MTVSASEFGRGYATCLRQFINHRARLRDDVNSPFLTDDPVWRWANGASDHLYDLVRPRKGITRTDWLIAQRMAARAIHIGHGFSVDKATVDEAEQWLSDAAACLVSLERSGYAVGTLDEAMETDRLLGLHPDRGQWSCSEDLRRVP